MRVGIGKSLFSSRGLRVAGVSALIVGLLWAIPARSSAMMILSSDVGDKDPCAQFVGDKGGTVIKKNIGGDKSEKPVNIMLQCSPLLEMPFGTLLADDLVVRQTYGHPSTAPFFRGGVASTGWTDTYGQPYLRGDIAEALRLQEFQGWPAIKDALIAAGVAATSSVAVSVIICLAGGIPTLGIACASVPAAIGAAAVEAVTAGIAAVVKDFINNQINRIKAMGDADWFIWSNTKVIWNSFGNIADTWINPSLTDFNPNPLHKDLVRIGVQWSNVPVGQGPEFFSAKSGGSGLSSKPQQSYQIGTPKQVTLLGATGDNTLIGTSATRLIRGGTGNNLIMAGPGSKAVYGGGGRNTIYAGRGNQVVLGGPRNNIIVGGPGYDVLQGGPGSDTIVDVSGRAVVMTGADKGPGKDFVYVRDGRGGDIVVCGSRRSTVVADASDTIIGPCGQVITSGPILRPPR